MSLRKQEECITKLEDCYVYLKKQYDSFYINDKRDNLYHTRNGEAITGTEEFHNDGRIYAEAILANKKDIKIKNIPKEDPLYTRYMEINAKIQAIFDDITANSPNTELAYLIQNQPIQADFSKCRNLLDQINRTYLDKGLLNKDDWPSYDTTHKLFNTFIQYNYIISDRNKFRMTPQGRDEQAHNQEQWLDIWDATIDLWSDSKIQYSNALFEKASSIYIYDSMEDLTKKATKDHALRQEAKEKRLKLDCDYVHKYLENYKNNKNELKLLNLQDHIFEKHHVSIVASKLKSIAKAQEFLGPDDKRDYEIAKLLTDISETFPHHNLGYIVRDELPTARLETYKHEKLLLETYGTMDIAYISPFLSVCRSANSNMSAFTKEQLQELKICNDYTIDLYKDIKKQQPDVKLPLPDDFLVNMNEKIVQRMAELEPIQVKANNITIPLDGNLNIIPTIDMVDLTYIQSQNIKPIQIKENNANIAKYQQQLDNVQIKNNIKIIPIIDSVDLNNIKFNNKKTNNNLGKF